MSKSRSQAYTDAGVNIEAGNSLVQRIKPLIRQTYGQGKNRVLSDIGGFGGLFQPDLQGMKEPVLVSSTDGVGTKLKLAFEFNMHTTVGIDLVAMSVNDILVQGAKPLFFLDYFACSELEIDKTSDVIAGIVDGCKQAGCALLGGETAEMPGMYTDGDYDLAGFCVGIVDKEKLVDGSNICEGDVIIGLSSSGIHSNGYSLARKIFAESGAKPEDLFPNSEKTFAQVLIEPTIIYTSTLKKLEGLNIKGMVHVTGGGFYDNIPRVLPENVRADINFGSWDMLPIFQWIKEQGKLSWPEMLQIFNCSIGYVLVVDKNTATQVMEKLATPNNKSANCSDRVVNAWRIGSIVSAVPSVSATKAVASKSKMEGSSNEMEAVKIHF